MGRGLPEMTQPLTFGLIAHPLQTLSLSAPTLHALPLTLFIRQVN